MTFISVVIKTVDSKGNGVSHMVEGETRDALIKKINQVISEGWIVTEISREEIEF